MKFITEWLKKIIFFVFPALLASGHAQLRFKKLEIFWGKCFLHYVFHKNISYFWIFKNVFQARVIFHHVINHLTYEGHI